MKNYRNSLRDRDNYYLSNKSYEYTDSIIGENVNQPLNIAGVWDSIYGKTVINQEGNKVTGYYEWYDGYFNGKMDGNILSGNWKEKTTYKPPTDAGQLLLEFTANSFTGKWSYGNQPLYYRWDGTKISNLLLGNCIRYQVFHNAPSIPTITVNGEKMSYGQQSSYFYPEECLPYTNLRLLIDGETYLEKIPVKPGYSYTFSIEGKKPELKIDVIVDNPFQ